MSQEKMIKLGTYNEYTPRGNSYDATDVDLSYNDSRPEKSKDKETKEENKKEED